MLFDPVILVLPVELVVVLLFALFYEIAVVVVDVQNLILVLLISSTHDSVRVLLFCSLDFVPMRLKFCYFLNN